MFEPTEAFERIYAEAFAPMHERFCAVWAAATGLPADAPATKLATLAMLGQILYFRVAPPRRDAPARLERHRPARGRGDPRDAGRPSRRRARRRAQGGAMILETLCSIGFVASWLSACSPPAASVVGYVEGEYVQIAPIDVARIVALDVRRGDLVKAGETIGSVEATDAEIAVHNAEGALAQAQAELANILYGRRPEEIAAIQATLDAAKVQTEDNKRSLDRERDLNARGFAPQADLDRAQTAYDVSSSRVKELDRQSRRRQAAGARRRNRRRPEPGQAGASRARSGALAARPAHADRAGGGADFRHHPPSRRSRRPDRAGRVDAARRRAQADALRARSRRCRRWRSASSSRVRCDGCPPGLTAAVSYIAREPEFTPPVIYSLDERQTLVYLVEARPAHDVALRLQPGQIVDVDLPQRRP